MKRPPAQEILISYSQLRSNYIFVEFLKKIANDRASAYKTLREADDPVARASLQIYDKIFTYLSDEVKYATKEVQKERK